MIHGVQVGTCTQRLSSYCKGRERSVVTVSFVTACSCFLEPTLLRVMRIGRREVAAHGIVVGRRGVVHGRGFRERWLSG